MVVMETEWSGTLTQRERAGTGIPAASAVSAVSSPSPVLHPHSFSGGFYDTTGESWSAASSPSCSQ